MELMLYEGLVPMLVRELNDYLTSDDDHHKRRREERLQGGKKRKLTDPTSPEMLTKVCYKITKLLYIIFNIFFLVFQNPRYFRFRF